MKKASKIILGVTAGVAALATEFVFHGYLDIMYKETIPKGIVKFFMTQKGTTGKSDFNLYNRDMRAWQSDQKLEIIDRKNPDGYNLKGYFYPSAKQSDVFVLFAHGYRSSHYGDPTNFHRYYHNKGYNFMSVDHVAAGDSEGKFVGFDYFEANDMLDWIDYLVERFGKDIKIILHGVSMGGATVCQMASRVPKQVKFIVSDCAYTSAYDQFKKMVNGAGINKSAHSMIQIVNAMNKRLAKYDLSQTDVRDSVVNSKVPMLFVHGKVDDFVPVEMCYELYDICNAEKEIFIVDDAYHAQSVVKAEKQYYALLDKYIEKYL